MLNYETHDAILEDQPNNEMLMEARIARIEAAVEHLTADVKDIKLNMQEFRRDLQGMNEEMYAGFAAANDATARVELSLCETRMEQKRLSSEQEALKTEQQAMRADLNAVRTDLNAVRTDLDAVRTEQKLASAELKGDIKALGEKMAGAFAEQNKDIEARVIASQNKIILWTAGIMVAIAGLALTIAKLFP